MYQGQSARCTAKLVCKGEDKLAVDVAGAMFHDDRIVTRFAVEHIGAPQEVRLLTPADFRFVVDLEQVIFHDLDGELSVVELTADSVHSPGRLFQRERLE